jgi:DNA-binding LytR/AlgR family response regulator
MAGVFLGLAGAFSTDEAALPLRLTYWVGVCLLGSIAGTAATAAATRVRGLSARRWLMGAAVFILLTAVLTPSIWAVTHFVFGASLDPSPLPGFLAPVAIVTAAMTALSFALNQAPVMTHAPSLEPTPSGAAEGEPPPAAAPARFLDRLPPKLRGAALFAVESEDHYLRLHTSRGQDLILMRLSDALAELDGLEGAQTHRSWWVARDGFDSARRSDGRALLRLRNEVEAPVSRTYARALRQAGWF